ncbi:MAG: NAD(P)-dependent oxidoreductase [Sphingomonadales bacterium]|nr:NAD(P)-dependent oxidoreductase [Sphingomonadales bacterium]NCQ20389.1 NAD(P)-dependent oxidoreductase [Sphingomonadales bacterium]NCT02997.1 NAD(P)-dependent oxidoreductase [Sphingomonadales bacterium]
MKRWVITGPTGWIGRALLDLLTSDDARDGLHPDQTISLFGSRAGTVTVEDGRAFPIRPLSEIGPDDVAEAYVVHLAYLTKDKVGELGEAAFRSGNETIDNTLLAALEQAAPAALFVASSGAARLAEIGADHHLYGVMKHEQERRFLAYGAAHDVPVLCGRIFNVAGPHINKHEAYAVSNFAVQALTQGSIRIEASQPVFRSLLHVTDLCRLVIRALRSGHRHSDPVDLCGSTVLEMADIAALVGTETGKDIPIHRPCMNFSSRSDYLGIPQDTKMLAMQFAVDLTEPAIQVRDTVNWIRKTL